MSDRVIRRDVLKGAAAAAALAYAPPPAQAQRRAVRVGVIGTGNRGGSLLKRVLEMPGATVPALCDVVPETLAKGIDQVQSAGRPKPEGYTGSEEAYRKLLDRGDLDAVIIAVPWKRHTEMAVHAMKRGVYAGIEVPAAQTVAECWDLVRTHEETGTGCMMLENWAFRRDNLAILNMIRLGMFGEIMHCHAAHGNDCVGRTPWYFTRQGDVRWGGKYLVERNADQYPTHSLGPVMSWMNINSGDAFDFIVTVTNRSLGINHHFAKTLGPDSEAARRHYAQGDIASSIIKTKRGNTIVLNNDMQSPRPYDNRWMIQGTDGVYSEERNSIYLWQRSPKEHEWEGFGPYQERYEHAWWKPLKPSAASSDQLAAGHGGTDGLMLRKFLEAARDKAPTPIDIYDSVTMSVVVPLSAESIAAGSTPVKFPDFTKGKWQSRKPYFALDQSAGA